jgi:hypothetical protein
VGFVNAPHVSGGTDKRCIAPGTTSDTVLKSGPGRLCRVIVTATGAAGVVIFDHDVANAGDLLGVVPPNAPIGSVYDFQTPAIHGMRIPGNSDLPGLIVTYY